MPPKPPFPAPPLPYTGHSPIHVIRSEVLRSPFFLTAFDDRGELETGPGRIVFTGMRYRIECPRVTSIQLERMPFPLFPAVLMHVVLTAGLALTPGPHARNPYLYPLITAFVAAWAWRVRRKQVIRVDYTDASESPRSIHLTSDPPFASGRRATRKLHDELAASVLESGR